MVIVKKHYRKVGRKRVKVKRHRRKTKPPRKIGTTWIGPKYVHGPRRRSPNLFSEFRLGKPMKTGKRLVFGKHKKTGKWAIQSTLVPK